MGFTSYHAEGALRPCLRSHSKRSQAVKFARPHMIDLTLGPFGCATKSCRMLYFHHVHDVELVPAAGTGCSWCQPTMGPYCEPPDSMHAQNSYLLLPVPRPFKVTFPESAQPQYRRTPVAILPSVYKSPLLNHLHPCFAIQFVVCRWPGFAWWSRRVT